MVMFELSGSRAPGIAGRGFAGMIGKSPCPSLPRTPGLPLLACHAATMSAFVRHGMVFNVVMRVQKGE